MKVSLLAYTPSPEEVVYASAKLCYSKVGVSDILKRHTKEQMHKLINRLLSMGHDSPLEHVSFTFAVEGVSRVLTHQLVRHRIASYSQQSQRYVREGQFDYIIPEEIEKCGNAKNLYVKLMEENQLVYNKIVEELMNKYKLEYQHEMYLNGCIVSTIPESELNVMEKRAIENARYAFPEGIETKIVFSMNVRTLLHFFSKRLCHRSQEEIRHLAEEMLKLCRGVSPTLFAKAGADCTYNKCNEGDMCCGSFRVDLRI